MLTWKSLEEENVQTSNSVKNSTSDYYCNKWITSSKTREHAFHNFFSDKVKITLTNVRVKHIDMSTLTQKICRLNEKEEPYNQMNSDRNQYLTYLLNNSRTNCLILQLCRNLQHRSPGTVLIMKHNCPRKPSDNWT